jgi:hypothetical protein
MKYFKIQKLHKLKWNDHEKYVGKDLEGSVTY